MRYEFWLGLRYLFAKRRERFISVIAALSVGGVAVGVAVLLVALAVMSGLQHGLREKFIGINAHLIIEAPDGVADPEALLARIDGAPHVAAATPFLSGQAILRLPERAFGVLVRGLDPEREPGVTRLEEYLVLGSLPSSDEEVVIGAELAALLRAGPGDELVVISPADGDKHPLRVSGIFRSGLYEYDAYLIGVTLGRAQRLFGLPGSASGIGVRLADPQRSEEARRALQERLGAGVSVKPWSELNPALFAALKLEKIGMFVLLALIVLVASANIISTLIMMVMERTRDIGILKTLGATPRSIGLLFTWQGLVIGLVGTAVGAALAGGLIWALDTYKFIRLPGDVYYLDYLPVRAEWGDWWKTLAAAVAITLGSTVYPARQAARLAPVEALRYE
ncbi:MAG TPA: ABC transporter permease [bacterium]